MTTSLVVHGHFYQPPRENPWTGLVERERSAQPFHDWNQRVHSECYRPNAFARVLDSYGRIERMVNNYLHLSFNFGPTLLNWMVAYDLVTYRRILQADRQSLKRFGGHGNAIAQAYNHSILPLCTPEDRVTQILWGLADFQFRFDRPAEALWLPETACTDAVLGTLIDTGMRYVILSPFQAERVRPLAGGEWSDVSDGTVDDSQPYQYLHRDGSGRSIAIFFYNGGLARGIAFEGSLYSSQTLVDRILHARGPNGGLVNVATDGESYGHHSHFGDRTLAYALEIEAPQRELEVTNYGQYLGLHPPTQEVEIKAGPGGEGTSWSCAHGVGRWYRDCGCTTGSQEGWNQAWRTPLRAALDFLRDQARAPFEDARGAVLKDPWVARNEYIYLVLDRDRGQDEFLARHTPQAPQGKDRLRALTLLELQRYCMLMYTSCGWFFADIGGIEATQVLKYAARAMDLLVELGAPSPRARFLEILDEAKSNVPAVGGGADIFRKQVETLRMTPQRLAAHLAISGLQGLDGEQGQIGEYGYQRPITRRGQQGRLTLATGQLKLLARVTGSEFDFNYAAVYFGGLDFYCVLRPHQGLRSLNEATELIWQQFATGSLLSILRLAQSEFGPAEFGLEAVLPDGRQQILERVFGNLIDHFYDQYARLYEDNRQIINLLHESGFELPRELSVAAEFTLSHRFEEEIARQQGNRSPEAYAQALQIAEEAARHGHRIEGPRSQHLFEEMIESGVRLAVREPNVANLDSVTELLRLCRELRIAPDLQRAQEEFYVALPDAKSALAERFAALGLALGMSPKLTHPN